jgi:signal transduction histidine kinase
MTSGSALRRQQDTSAQGRAFEEAVADVYRLLGYEVERNVLLDGQEIDLLARRPSPGAGEQVLIVECKYKSAGSKCGNADVQSISGALNIARARGLAGGCTVVTTNGFTPAARAAAKAAGIHLTTQAALVRSLIDFSPYLSRLANVRRERLGSADASWYIDPQVHSRLPSFATTLNEYVDSWWDDGAGKPIAILGGYGTGKSSFCLQYATRPSTLERCVPVIIQLRGYSKALSIESLIRDFLDLECGSLDARFRTFWRMFEEGLVLLMFDGLDEMAARVDRDTLEANLLQLERFARVGRVIVTCRPEYFVTDSEERAALDPSSSLTERTALYAAVHIELWSAVRIRLYVQRRIAAMSPPAPLSAQFYIDRIEALPELSNVADRAVHLDLIVRFLPHMIRSGRALTRPSLYETYVREELKRETVHNNRLRIISDDDRLALLRAVTISGTHGRQQTAASPQNSVRLHHLTAGIDIRFEDAAAIVSRQLAVPKAELESVTRDFLQRSFLTREGDTYQFAHRSIGEYLWAMEAYDRLTKGDIEFIATQSVSAAMAGMLLDFFGGIEAFQTFRQALGLPDDDSLSIEHAAAAAVAALSVSDYLSSILSVLRTGSIKDESSLRRVFIGEVHDTNNTVVVMMGYAELVLSREMDGTELKEIRAAWKRFLERLQRVVRVKFNQITGELSYRVVRNWFAIDDLLAYAQCLIPGGRVDVRNQGGHFYGDLPLLERAVENIALNAKHATDNGGTVRIEAMVANDELIMRFENTGPRIPAKHIGKIFDLGFTTRKEGHGVGLAVCRDVIEAHGGRIIVSSSKELTTFTVAIPSTAPSEKVDQNAADIGRR